MNEPRINTHPALRWTSVQIALAEEVAMSRFLPFLPLSVEIDIDPVAVALDRTGFLAELFMDAFFAARDGLIEQANQRLDNFFHAYDTSVEEAEPVMGDNLVALSYSGLREMVAQRAEHFRTTRFRSRIVALTAGGVE